MTQRRNRYIWQIITNYGYGNEVEYETEDKLEAEVVLSDYKREKMQGFLPTLLSVHLKRRKCYV